MINAKELRIGNLVQNRFFPNPEPVTGLIEREPGGIVIQFLVGGLREMSPRAISGIPITKEWLERFGFKQGETRYYFELSLKNKGSKFYLTYSIYNKSLHISKKDYEKGFNIPNVFDVHQMQNICFSITGVDLNFQYLSIPNLHIEHLYRMSADKFIGNNDLMNGLNSAPLTPASE
jgi:hypothetical protein